MNEAARIPRPADEALRLQALRRYALLDSEAEAPFDLLAELAAELCGAPYAFVSLVDEDRVWYKARHGTAVRQLPRDEDYCAWSVLEAQGLHIADLSQDARTSGLRWTREEPCFRMYGGANLISSDGQPVGVLCVLDTKPRTLSERQRELLQRLAQQVVALMELRVKERELARALAEVSRLATEDPLTGLLNRRALMQALRREVQMAKRLGTPLALLMLDLDHFKSINDRHGHAMGDAVLRGTAELLRESLRAVDLAGRLGGEEFCVVLPGTDAAGARVVAEGLRARIAASLHQDGGREARVTVSVGTAQFAPDLANADALLRRADEALYRAKGAGRDRVEAG